MNVNFSLMKEIDVLICEKYVSVSYVRYASFTFATTALKASG
ncbi:hypothetical protein EZS27_020885 [termite gut metagenome]|uniref:Uncharacterized protein n=1 Tax=termite gut metagenome TaxID=433724 RepID=A0A5J4R8X7_9ZZZZ